MQESRSSCSAWRSWGREENANDTFDGAFDAPCFFRGGDRIVRLGVSENGSTAAERERIEFRQLAPDFGSGPLSGVVGNLRDGRSRRSAFGSLSAGVVGIHFYAGLVETFL